MTDQEILAAYHAELSKMGKWPEKIRLSYYRLACGFPGCFYIQGENFGFNAGIEMQNDKIAVLACRGAAFETLFHARKTLIHWHHDTWSQETDGEEEDDPEEFDSMDEAIIAALKQINEKETGK